MIEADELVGMRKNKLAQKLVPITEKALENIERWRDTHR
jgi:hypothetical protein